MDANEKLVNEKFTENVDPTTTEKIVETDGTGDVQIPAKETPPPKMYTQEELDDISNTRVRRREGKIHKDYDQTYGELVRVLQAGTGEKDIGKITQAFKSHYEGKGVDMSALNKPHYSDEDTAILARADAQAIIDAGNDEIADEIGRLEKIGVDNMSSRDKAVFAALTAHKTEFERNKALAEIGVPETVYNSAEFKAYANQFKESVPITDVYKQYAKASKTTNVEPIGSLKNGSHKEEETYYSSEDVDKLTPADYDNPVVFRNVRESMKKWPKMKG